MKSLDSESSEIPSSLSPENSKSSSSISQLKPFEQFEALDIKTSTHQQEVTIKITSSKDNLSLDSLDWDEQDYGDIELDIECADGADGADVMQNEVENHTVTCAPTDTASTKPSQQFQILEAKNKLDNNKQDNNTNYSMDTPIYENINMEKKNESKPEMNTLDSEEVRLDNFMNNGDHEYDDSSFFSHKEKESSFEKSLKLSIASSDEDQDRSSIENQFEEPQNLIEAIQNEKVLNISSNDESESEIISLSRNETEDSTNNKSRIGEDQLKLTESLRSPSFLRTLNNSDIPRSPIGLDTRDEIPPMRSSVHSSSRLQLIKAASNKLLQRSNSNSNEEIEQEMMKIIYSYKVILPMIDQKNIPSFTREKYNEFKRAFRVFDRDEDGIVTAADLSSFSQWGEQKSLDLESIMRNIFGKNYITFPQFVDLMFENEYIFEEFLNGSRSLKSIQNLSSHLYASKRNKSKRKRLAKIYDGRKHGLVVSEGDIDVIRCIKEKQKAKNVHLEKGRNRKEVMKRLFPKKSKSRLSNTLTNLSDPSLCTSQNTSPGATKQKNSKSNTVPAESKRRPNIHEKGSFIPQSSSHTSRQSSTSSEIIDGVKGDIVSMFDTEKTTLLKPLNSRARPMKSNSMYPIPFDEDIHDRKGQKKNMIIGNNTLEKKHPKNVSRKSSPLGLPVFFNAPKIPPPLSSINLQMQSLANSSLNSKPNQTSSTNPYSRLFNRRSIEHKQSHQNGPTKATSHIKFANSPRMANANSVYNPIPPDPRLLSQLEKSVLNDKEDSKNDSVISRKKTLNNPIFSKVLHRSPHTLPIPFADKQVLSDNFLLDEIPRIPKPTKSLSEIENNTFPRRRYMNQDMEPDEILDVDNSCIDQPVTL